MAQVQSKKSNIIEGTGSQKAFIDIIRQTTETVQVRQKEEHDRRAAQEKRDTKTFEKTILPRVIATGKTDIEKAANDGQTRASVWIFMWADHVPDWADRVTKDAKKHFEKEGFTINKVQDTVDKPFGSDPMFYHTVYGRYLDISWQNKSAGA